MCSADPRDCRQDGRSDAPKLCDPAVVRVFFRTVASVIQLAILTERTRDCRRGEIECNSDPCDGHREFEAGGANKIRNVTL